MDDKTRSSILIAFEDDPNEFQSILGAPITSLEILPVRLNMNGKLVELSNSHSDAQKIYKTIVAALQSDWFQSLGDHSQCSIRTILFGFFYWFNSHPINPQNCMHILNDYQAHRVNKDEIKPNSVRIGDICNVLRNGIFTDLVDQETLIFVDTLLNNTTISLNEDVEQVTLTSFFSSMPWLRRELGEHDYLRIESPKRLIDSFSIAVASTLLLIIEAKKQAIKKVDSKQIGLAAKNLECQRDRMNHWGRDLLMQLGKINLDGQPEEILTELLILDLIRDNCREYVLDTWRQDSNNVLRFKPKIEGKYQPIFGYPLIFSPDYFSGPSIIEQTLCAWLCACQVVQPSDIAKLKLEDFVISKNRVGRPLAMQCVYYKGRSGCTQELPMLDAKQVEARALLAYLEYLPMNGSSQLFTTKVQINKPLTFFRNDTSSSRLLSLWKSPLICRYIETEVIQRKSSLLFVRAYTSMARAGGEVYSVWKHLADKEGRAHSIKDYRRSVQHYLPMSLFSLTALKNSAVHARTDKYRDGDLVNYNSHTSETEKVCYLTDANNEWVNQNGRLTRLVMDDMQNYVFCPRLDFAIQKAREKVMLTRIQRVTNNGGNNINVNSLGHVIQEQTLLAEEPDDILVLDTSDTVVNMIHYISEAERQYNNLINNALIFFENTVLPNVEWMSVVLQQHLSPSVVKDGEKIYNSIHSVLPPLFVNELQGGVGT